MGGSTWSDSFYESKAASLRAAGKTAFDYHDSVTSGKIVAKAHETMDPAKMKAGRRECRDSTEHPNTTPIFVGLDVTGSMQSVPRIIQGKLKELMGLLLRKGYAEDPSICVCGIGDAEMFDKAPFQVGQFEAGIEIDDHIGNLYLEGGGGGNQHESYDLALYFLARCVDTDAWEKRKEKGFAFIICDEKLPTRCLKKTIKSVFNHTVQEDIPITDLLKEVREKWNLFCIVPNMTSHYRTGFQDSWVEHLGQNVIYLDDPDTVSETIGACVGLTSDNVNDLVSDLTDVGLSSDKAEVVSRALAEVKPGTIGKLGGTGLATL